jgi:hypothetical protein
MWYTQWDSVIHYKVIRWLFLLGHALLETSIIHSGIYYTLDFLILCMRFNFHMLRFIFLRNIWIFIIHLLTAYSIIIQFICQRYSRTFRRFNLNCFLHWPDIIATSDFAMDFVFRIRVLIRETFAIVKVTLSTTIIFSQHSHNVRLFYLFVISQTRDNLLFCVLNTLMRALSVLDFIFIMILFMRCLTFFMRCSLHENERVCSYFFWQAYIKLESTGIPIDFSLIVYKI